MSTSYPPPPPEAPPPLPGSGPSGPAGPPPSVVTTASRLMYAEIALSIIATVIALASIGNTKDSIRKGLVEQGKDASDDVVNTATYLGIGIGVLITVLVVVGFAVLARLVLRGVPAARIVTWVLCALFLCCAAFQVVGVGSGNSTADLPGWQVAWNWLYVLLQFAIFIGIAVLLALPAANAYFRRPKA